jgi:hypothetical protein
VKTANSVISGAFLMAMVFMSKKAAYNDARHPSIDRYGCTGAKNRGGYVSWLFLELK